MGAFVLHDIVPPLIRREFRFHVVKNVLLSRFSQGTLQLFPMIRSDALHCSLMDDEEVLYSTNLQHLFMERSRPRRCLAPDRIDAE